MTACALGTMFCAQRAFEPSGHWPASVRESASVPVELVRHANVKLDECRRRVQNETLGHAVARRSLSDPRPLTMADVASRSGASLVGLVQPESHEACHPVGRRPTYSRLVRDRWRCLDVIDARHHEYVEPPDCTPARNRSTDPAHNLPKLELDPRILIDMIRAQRHSHAGTLSRARFSPTRTHINIPAELEAPLNSSSQICPGSYPMLKFEQAFA